MSHVFGKYGPAHPRLGRIAFHAVRPLATAWYGARGFYRPDSRFARARAASMRERLGRGETVYLMGVGPSGHNAGVALIEASQSHGVRLICNEEEERFSGVKHYAGHPELSVESLRCHLNELGIGPQDIHACLASWNYVDFLPFGARVVAEHLPFSLPLAHPSSSPKFSHVHVWRAAAAPGRLGRQFGLDGPMRIIGMRHHDNHAYFAYGASPFNRAETPVMVTVLDGYGDDGAASLFVARRGQLELIRSNHSLTDSLGAFYSVISSTQGGWTTLSSEGRYMGASAWGDNDRLTNPYYRRLRQLFYFADEGRFYINREMIKWHKWGEMRPYGKALEAILGLPIPREKMWNPDAVLQVEDVKHSEATQERLDKAAATQLVFEDVLFHVVDFLIRLTGSDKLVMSGGTALNCLASMRLLDRFDQSYYRRYLGKDTRLQLWVPPTPGDAGVAMGAAFNFALSNGAPVGPSLRHAFYCGTSPSRESIRLALEGTPDIAHMLLGDVNSQQALNRVADYAAYVVAHDGVMGLFQGAAETGPRALGHRTIVANPCNPNTLQIINALVKFRERIRPLAPIATYEAAHRYFDLSPGAAADDYNVYNYMVLTAQARPESLRIIPAVVHHDGTGRVQIVREDVDPFTHAYLKAMGRRLGVEISVNTSLNVGGPIAQTPAQALDALKRSKGMTGLLMVAAEGDAFLAWHNVVSPPPKDAGQQLLAWHRQWQAEEASEPACVTRPTNPSSIPSLATGAAEQRSAGSPSGQ
jgi:carbamoyltransferase